MNNLYENNIKELKIRKAYTIDDFEEVLDNIDIDDNVKVENNIMYFKYNDNYMQINSKFLKSEVDEYIRDVDFQKDNMIILHGIGNVELLKRIFINSTQDSLIFVIEPNSYVMKFVLENFDITWAIKSNMVRFAFGGNDNIRDYFSGCRGNIELAFNIISINNPNYYMYDKDYKEYITQFNKTIKESILSKGNDMEDRMEIFKGTYKNIENMFDSNSIEEVFQKYKGYPAFIVASGPSLEKNIHELKRAKGKSIIIACDASNRICLEEGIVPDIMASIERGVEVYKYFYKDKVIDDKTVLIGPSSLWSNIFSEYEGKKIMTTRLRTGIDKWMSKFFKRLKFLSQGMSCAHTAFATAAVMGCNPIVLVGQDLAYTDDKQHSDKVHEDFEDDNKAEDTDIWVKDIYGNDVKTSIIFNIFRGWFEKVIASNKSISVIDATEGGAYISGTIIKTLKETIDEYCIKDIPYQVKDILSDIHISDNNKIKKYKEILSFAKKEKNNIRLINNRANQHCKLLEDVMNRIKKDGVDSVSLEELVEVTLKGENAVDYLRKNNLNTYSFYFTAIDHLSMRIRTIGRTINKENLIKNIIYQIHMMNEIMDISSLITETYDGMIEYLQEKISG